VALRRSLRVVAIPLAKPLITLGAALQGWCLDEEKDAYCIPIDSDAVIEWAGLEADDLIREVP